MIETSFLGLVAIPAAAGRLDRFAALSGRFPVLAGLVLVGLGAWSVWFGLFATVDPGAPAAA